MEIIEEIQSGINIFKLNGRLDSNTSQGFEKKVFQAIDDGSKSMIIDFKDLDLFQAPVCGLFSKQPKRLSAKKGR